MGDAQDFITSAFIAALASYQKDHGQDCTYDVDRIPKSTTTAAAAGVALAKSSRGECNQSEQICVDTTEDSETGSKRVPLENQAVATARLDPCQHEQYDDTHEGQQQQQQQRRPQLQADHANKQQQHSKLPGRRSKKQQDEDAAAAQHSMWRDAGMNNWQSPRAHAASAYGSWDNTAAAGWGPQGYGYQPCMPPPPPPPPLPPACFMHPGQQQVCRICGQPAPTWSQVAGTAATRDHAAVLAGMQQQVPLDIAATPDSLRAAKAAMEKATAVSSMQDSMHNMPELLMAWFYAGYHAGNLSSTGCSSSEAADGSK